MIKVVRPEQLSICRRVDEGSVRREKTVREILSAVRTEGDAALRRYTKELDGVDLKSLEVEESGFEEAYRQVSQPFVQSLRKAVKRIRRYHEGQKRRSWMETEKDGTVLGQLIRPLARVGIYVPGAGRLSLQCADERDSRLCGRCGGSGDGHPAPA